jgi:cell division protein FtsZ
MAEIIKSQKSLAYHQVEKNKSQNDKLKVKDKKIKKEINKSDKLTNKKYYGPRIKIIGVGGAGGNIVARLRKKSKADGLDYLAINTDKQALSALPRLIKKIIIGQKITGGLGAGMNPDIGRAAAEEDEEIIKEEIKKADMVFILAGFGGGTGTGATPVIAEIARKLGILTVVLAIRPFSFEGEERLSIAENGFKEVLNFVDTAIFLSNEQLFSHLPEGVSLLEGFDIADNIFSDGLLGIFNILIEPGLINLDFADLRVVLENGGQGILAIGEGEGDKKDEEIIKGLLKNIPPDFLLKNSKRIFYAITSSPSSAFSEIQKIIEKIKELSNPEAKIIFGISIDLKLHNKVKATLIATSSDNSSTFLASNYKPIEQKDKEKDKNKSENYADFKKKEDKQKIFEETKNQKYQDSLYDELDIPAFIRRRLHK